MPNPRLATQTGDGYVGSVRRLLLLLVMGACMLVPASGAHAAVAYIDENGVATAEGEPGQVNDMSARAGEDGVIFTDAAGIRPRDPDSGCRALSNTEVTCGGGGGGLLLGRDGNDTLRDAGAAVGFGARGGSGNDTIVAGAINAILFGDERTISASDGDDTITGSSATELIGNGVDFNDSIHGGGGNDTIDAAAGRDFASGDDGNDRVSGGDGDDFLDSSGLRTDADEDAWGDTGNDTLNGDAGNDQLNGNRGKDKLNGGDGDDFLIASDWDIGSDDSNADTLNCGAGSDRIAPGHTDKVALGCETMRVAMYCTGGYPCKVTGSITHTPKGAKKSTTVAKASRTIDSPEPVDFTLGKKAKKALGSAKKVSLFAQLAGRRGTRVVSGRFVNFYLTK